MLGLFQTKEPSPEERIGPDGMTDFARDLRGRAERRDEAIMKLASIIGERLDLDPEIVQSIDGPFLIAAMVAKAIP